MKSLNFFLSVLLLTFFGSKSIAQQLIKVSDKDANKIYLVKCDNTKFKIRMSEKYKIITDKIDSINDFGIYFKKSGFIEFTKIKSINFRPYSKYQNAGFAWYYFSMTSFTLFSIYKTNYDNGRYGLTPESILADTFILWAGIIPGLVKLALLASHPRVTVFDIDKSIFSYEYQKK